MFLLFQRERQAQISSVSKPETNRWCSPRISCVITFGAFCFREPAQRIRYDQWAECEYLVFFLLCV